MATSLSRRSCAEPPAFIKSRSLRNRMRELLLSAGPIIGSAHLRQLRRIESIGGMQRPHGKLSVGRIDQNRDFDLGSGDRFNIDALLCKRSKHRARNADL